MTEQEQTQQIPQEEIPLPFVTKAGMMLPVLPVEVLNAVLHGGPGPFLFTTLVCGLATWQSPAIVKMLAKNESVLIALANRPEALAWFDRRSHGLFSEHLMELRKKKPKLFNHIPQPKEAMLLAQEADFSEPTEEEADDLIADLIIGDRQQATFPASSIIGSNPRRRLNMADNFQPDSNAPLATGVAAFGIPGSGKTTVIVRFLEQYVEQYRLPFVAFDSQGDFRSLVESGFCPRGVIATPENLPDMAYVVKRGLQVVVDLSEWREGGRVEMSIELAAQVITHCIRSLMAAQKAIDPANRVPCLVALDEAQLWVPEGSSGFMAKETGNQIKTAVMGLATTGRKLGVVPFLAGPRIAQIDKDAIAGIETRIFGKADLDNDIRRYRDYISTKDTTDEQIRRFGQGEFIVSMNGQRLFVCFYNRSTQHISHTPRVSRSLERFASTLPAEMIDQITQATSSLRKSQERETVATKQTQSVRTHHGMSSYDARRKQLEARKKPVYAGERKESNIKAMPQAPKTELDQALEAYDAGNTTIDALAVALGKTAWTVRPLYAQVKKLRSA